MKNFIILFLLLLCINGCTDTPSTIPDQESVVQTKISKNRLEALRAKEEYIRLQQTRKH
jgi:hypothetical protein